VKLRAPRRFLLAAVAIAALALALQSKLPGAADALAYLLPALLGLAALTMRRYPGERALLRLARGRRVRRRRQHRRSPLAQRRRRALVPRGGRLIACSLAVRPPPPLANRIS
jgi:hypothetical protein